MKETNPPMAQARPHRCQSPGGAEARFAVWSIALLFQFALLTKLWGPESNLCQAVEISDNLGES